MSKQIINFEGNNFRVVTSADKFSDIFYTKLDGAPRNYHNPSIIEKRVTKTGNKLVIIQTENGDYKALREEFADFVNKI